MLSLSQEKIDAYRRLIVSVTEHEPMARHTSFRIGGPARLYVVANSSDALVHAVDAALKVGIPWYVFGGGSNLLVADEGFEGVMIQAANRGFEVKGEQVHMESGLFSVLAARKTVEAGLTGFEWAISLPGTIGGAIYGNAGCFGGETRTHLVAVDAYRVQDQKRVTLTNQEAAFSYRDSLFKQQPHVILGGTFVFERSSDIAKSRARLEEILQARKEEQPVGFVSAGCVFKNVMLDDKGKVDLLSRLSTSPAFDHDSGTRVAAGWLVEQAGLKGLRVGEVEVSQKHGNFFLSKTTARAADVMVLATQVKQVVREKFGVDLHEEVQFVGF